MNRDGGERQRELMVELLEVVGVKEFGGSYLSVEGRSFLDERDMSNRR